MPAATVRTSKRSGPASGFGIVPLSGGQAGLGNRVAIWELEAAVADDDELGRAVVECRRAIRQPSVRHRQRPAVHRLAQRSGALPLPGK